MARDPVRSDRLALAALGAGLLVVSGVAVARDVGPPWRSIQDRAREVVRERVGAEAAARVPSGVLQDWIQDAARVDRCRTCHVAMDGGERLLAAENPARSHPRPELLSAHPPETFGCTLCHGGRGAAVSVAEAHGLTGEWEDPLVTSADARRYGLTLGEFLEARCNACHRREEKVVGMPLLDEAKALVQAKRCRSCHAIDGKGGREGPDLTFVGDERPERVHFPASWAGERTALAWHVAHLKDPESVVPGSEMTRFPFTDRQATALALLVRSWRRTSLPARMTPRR